MNFMFFPSNKPTNPEIFVRNKHTENPKNSVQKQNPISQSPHFSNPSKIVKSQSHKPRKFKTRKSSNPRSHNPHFFNHQTHFETQSPTTTLLKSPPWTQRRFNLQSKRHLEPISTSLVSRWAAANHAVTATKSIQGRSASQESRSKSIKGWSASWRRWRTGQRDEEDDAAVEGIELKAEALWSTNYFYFDFWGFKGIMVDWLQNGSDLG